MLLWVEGGGLPAGLKGQNLSGSHIFLLGEFLLGQHLCSV